MDSVRVEIILTADIKKYWPVMVKYFEQAIARGDGSITIESTRIGLNEGTQYAVIAYDDIQPIGAATIMHATAGDGKKILLIALLSSEPNQFFKWFKTFSWIAYEMAAWLDVDCIEINGRTGWAKVLNNFVNLNGVLRNELKKTRSEVGN